MNIRKLKTIFLYCCALALAILSDSCNSPRQEPRILVFSKTAAFHHESIAQGIEAIKKLGEKHHFIVDTTDNASNFNEDNLKKYKVVIFLSTTGDVLNQEQQNDFERFIQAGGGYVGIHAATDTEYDWAWYGRLAGGYFNGHPGNPNVQKGTYYVVDKTHPATDSIPERWERMDEFYNFKQLNPDIRVLIKIDEKTYHEGKMGDDHPMAWYHDYDGGRAFYTNMGHTPETFSDPLFLKHLWGGIYYAMGGKENVSLDYSHAHTPRVPEETRFTKVVLDQKLDEPTELALLPEGRVLFIERKGNVKIYDPTVQQTKVIAKIAVNTKYLGGTQEAEDGLLGVAIDPGFKQNHWIYLFYSKAGDEPKNILVRYELNGDELVEASKKVLLEVVVQRNQCCHTGGSITFDGNGNLFLSTGDNTSPFATAYSPADERPGRSPWDAQKSSANTNDLRGKILRIHPEPDGTYTIPEGNLFPKGMEKTRPEIYVMGERNPYRISVDKKTGFLYWGDVGPDAAKDSAGRGTLAFDEVNQARKPGYFGWPYFVGDNQAYNKWDFTARKSGKLADPLKPVNYSPNNTGIHDLPPAQKAFIWYPYGNSLMFPLTGSGGRTAMAGPVFYAEDFKSTPRPFPDYYNGRLFIYEWMRGWIMTVAMDKEGNFVSMERFMPSHRFSNPMDMEFSKETGDLYMLEYGLTWFHLNDDARLVRIEYNKGNRKPFVQLSADKKQGAVPMTVNFSSHGTRDYDHDELTYAWDIVSQSGTTIKTLTDPDPSFTFDQPGQYQVKLTVTDSKGEKSGGEVRIDAGNEPPTLTFETAGNKTFFFPNHPLAYEVKVTDREDGSLESGRISQAEISVTMTYMKGGFDQVEVAQRQLSADASAAFAYGKKIMELSDCKSCHQIDKKSIGPMYRLVAEKYKNDPQAVSSLSDKIINGGRGVWGETAMAAHPQMSKSDATEIIKYILSLSVRHEAGPSLPPKGSYVPKIPAGIQEQGLLVMRAAYSDHGANSLPPIMAEQIKVLRSPTLAATKADQVNGTVSFRTTKPTLEFMIYPTHKSFLAFNQIDLTGIDQLKFSAAAPQDKIPAAGGVIEVRIDSPTGALIGQTSFLHPPQGKLNSPVIISTTARIVPTSGVHTVYFIAKNEKAAAGQPLLMIQTIQFENNSK